jgi:hypothetical protein
LKIFAQSVYRIWSVQFLKEGRGRDVRGVRYNYAARGHTPHVGSS